MPAVLEGKIPLKRWYTWKGKSERNMSSRILRTEFSTNLVHSRKISIRAMIEMEIGCENLDRGRDCGGYSEQCLYL